MRNALLTALVFCLLTAALPASARGSFIYVSNYGDGTISQFQVSANGTLTPFNPPTVPAFPHCHSLVADPQGRFLYALSTLEFSTRNCRVSQFQIGPDGTLTPLSPATVQVSSVGSGPSLIVMRPDGRGAYVLGRAGYDTAFRIESNGRLTPTAPIQTANEGITGAITHAYFHPALPLLYLSEQASPMGPDDSTTGGIYVYAVPPDVSPLGKPIQSLEMWGDTPLGLFLARGGQFAYVPHNWGGIPRTSQYRVDKEGKLTLLSPPSALLAHDVTAAFVDPASHFLYAVSRPDDRGRDDSDTPPRPSPVRLCRYAIRANGQLGRQSAQTLPVSASVTDAKFDPSGHVLYLLTGNGIRPFRVAPSGAVTPLTTQSIRAGRGPLEMIYVQN